MATRCGYVALLGKPNVGKSTLLNRILGLKLSITSRRPQTTRHRILGIKTKGDVQALYLDTPGLHDGGGRAMNHYLNRAAKSAMYGIDVIVFLVGATRWTREDSYVAELLGDVDVPVIVAINKIDRLDNKDRLLPFIDEVNKHIKPAEIVPVSALTGQNAAQLEAAIDKHLPLAPWVYAEDQLTDRSERFLAAELIREKLTRKLAQELPYALTVEIEKFEDDKDGARIFAIVWVEKSSQKGIVIGKGGALLKQVGQEARRDMMKLFDRRVHLEIWVKVRKGWSDDERSLQQLGYVDFES